MKIRSLAVITFLLTVCVVYPVALAQGNDGEACSSKTIVYPRTILLIRDEPGLTADRVRYAKPGERLNVLLSQRQGPWCWLRVTGGWLVDNVLLQETATTTASTTETTTTTTSTTVRRACYSSAKAYVAGPMNIRQRATTDSRIVARANFGAVYDALGSQQGDKYCWVKISKGWIANTSRLSHTKPLPPPTPVPAPPPAVQAAAPAAIGSPHHIVNSQGRHIPIYGDDRFRHLIASAFYYIRDNVPAFWPYLSIIDDVKFDWHACSAAYACAGWPHQVVYFGPVAYEVSIRGLASTLIHEACHFYQLKEHRSGNYDWNAEWGHRAHEQECVAKQREAGL